MDDGDVKSLRSVELAGKRVLIRADLNVPIDAGQVISDARIVASLASIEYALAANASVVISSCVGPMPPLVKTRSYVFDNV